MTDDIQTPGERHDWLALRQSGIGGSDVAAILGLDLFGRTIETVYDEKVGAVEDLPPSPAMLRGRYLEGIVVQLYTEETGRQLRRMAMQRHKDHPHMIANIDRQQVKDPRGPGVLEVKAPGLHVFSRLRMHGLSEAYQLQMNHYLEVKGYSWGTFALFNAERWKLIFFDVERDPEVGAFLVEKESAFWRMVENRERPVAASVVLPDMPEIKGEVVVRTDPEWEQAVGDMRDALGLLHTAEEIEEYARNRLKLLMGGYGVHEGAGARCYFRPQGGRKTFDRKALERAGPLDAEKVALLLASETEEAATNQLLERILQDARLDLTQFEKVGNSFDTFRPYLLKPGVEE